LAFDFCLRGWSAFSTGLYTPESWLNWAAQPYLPQGETVPALPEMPAMARRRVNTLGRMALQVAYWSQEQPAPDVPVVLASRYGDLERSLALLADMAAQEPMSPTGFGLSVHNAIGALYSIARGDRGNYIAVAAGADSAAVGVVEAAGLLADGAPEVLLLCYDSPLPGAYSVFQDEPAATYAWAWRLTRPAAGMPRFSLSRTMEGASPVLPPGLPYGLDVLRFALSSDRALARPVDGVVWEWQRHG
jgi:hypothetical protein